MSQSHYKEAPGIDHSRSYIDHGMVHQDRSLSRLTIRITNRLEGSHSQPYRVRITKERESLFRFQYRLQVHHKVQVFQVQAFNRQCAQSVPVVQPDFVCSLKERECVQDALVLKHWMLLMQCNPMI